MTNFESKKRESELITFQNFIIKRKHFRLLDYWTIRLSDYSTVTLLAKFLGWSTSVPLKSAI